MKRHVLHILVVLALALSFSLITAVAVTPVLAAPAPTVTGISPASGPVAGGTPVTITGMDFTTSMVVPLMVTIGGASATGVVLVSPTSITAITPAGSAGARDVVVTTTSGVGTLPGGFTYHVPSITVTYPDGGETWPTGYTQSITWISSGVFGNVKIELSMDGGSTWPTTLFASTPDDGTEAWTVVGLPTTQARMKITSVSDSSVSDMSNANFTILSTMTVTAPNGGETWPIGSSQTITWTSAYVTGNVKIQLSRDNGATWATLLASTPNDGIQAWTVTGAPTTQAMIKITGVSIPSAYDTSDSSFTIPPPSITVTSPNGGETWPIGSSQTITWTSVSVTGNVQIRRSANAGLSWTTIVSSTPNDGSYTWTVTGPSTTQARIKIVKPSTPPVFDISDANFTVPPPSLTVTSSNGGETWAAGGSHDITWNSVSVVGNVKIELSRDSGDLGGAWTTLAASTPNDGNYAWTVIGPGTTQARVRVRSLAFPAATDTSDADFTVTAPSITVTAPNGGETWPIGSVQNFSWTMAGVTGNVKIEVSRNNGLIWTTLVPSVPGLGLSWGAVSGPGTTQALVKVSSVLVPSAFDISDANFMILPTITVTTPNGGETWAIGSSQTITWTSAGVTGNVKIEGSVDGGGSWGNLVGSTANTGSMAWTGAGFGSGTTQARVKVSSVLNPAVFDISDANFTVPPPSISVGSPNGGEIYPPTTSVGTAMWISWNSVGVLGGVDIQLSRDGGANWATIPTSTIPGVANLWWVTGPGTTQARIKVSSILDPSVFDISNADFTILSPTITVTAPNGGKTWATDGSSHTITWTSFGVYGNVKIELSRNGGATWTTLVASTPNTGSKTWTGVTGPGSTDFARVRVTSLSSAATDASDADFTVEQQSIKVWNPSGGVTWIIGTTQWFSWNPAGVTTGNVKIELSLNGGTSWTTLVASTANTGSWAWTVSGLGTTTAYVRITSVLSPWAWGIRGPFTISP